MIAAFLGCNYPTPLRMLSLCEKLVKLYLSRELCGTVTQSEEFDIFATEGAPAAMTYLFHSLQINGLIKKIDKVAIITPIFSPYLEIPCIPEFDLEILSETIYDKEFTTWFIQKATGADFIITLARETGVVLLPGKGFNIEHPSARVSLANLTEHNYRDIGVAVKKILDEYYEQYKLA